MTILLREQQCNGAGWLLIVIYCRHVLVCYKYFIFEVCPKNRADNANVQVVNIAKRPMQSDR